MTSPVLNISISLKPVTSHPGWEVSKKSSKSDSSMSSSKFVPELRLNVFTRESGVVKETYSAPQTKKVMVVEAEFEFWSWTSIVAWISPSDGLEVSKTMSYPEIETPEGVCPPSQMQQATEATKSESLKSPHSDDRSSYQEQSSPAEF